MRDFVAKKVINIETNNWKENDIKKYEKEKKSLQKRIEKYEQDINKYKEYDQKRSKKHNEDLVKADTLLDHVTMNYKKLLELIERVLDNAKMQQSMDIKNEMKTFKNREEQQNINLIINYFEEKFAKRKKNMFLNLQKRYKFYLKDLILIMMKKHQDSKQNLINF